MVFDKEVLQKAATLGSQEASFAFAKLSSERVSISVSEVTFVSPTEVSESMAFYEKSMPIVAYAQMITGVEGVSVFAMTRDEALNFVDLLNNKPIGTTGILMDIDRSAIKETLNIISNAFLTSLAKHSDITLFFSDPHLITTPKLNEIFGKLDKSQDSIIIFKTELEIAQHNIKAQLFLLFDSQLSNILNNI